jgi:hypothetical protein
LCIPLELDEDDLDRRCNAFLGCACLMKSCGLLPHNPLWQSFFFGASSHIHKHNMNGKLQAYDSFELALLELAPHFFLLQP